MKSVGIVCVVGLGLITLVFGTGGCGSGGGGGGGAAPLAGTALFGSVNFVVSISGDNTGLPMVVRAGWGECTSDGLGNFTAGMLTMTNATFGSFGWTYEYDISPARVVTWSSLGSEYGRGAISADGRVSIVGSHMAGNDPGFFITLKKAGTFSNASLDGDYHACGWEGGATPHISYWGRMTFDGAGLVDYTLNTNPDGGPAVPPIAAVGSGYTVAADGAVNLGLFGGLLLLGGILDGGDLVVVAGSGGVGIPRVFILIRESTAATTNTFSGPYSMVSMSRLVPAAGYRSQTGTLVANPATGTIDNVVMVENTDGVVPPPGPPGGGMTYTVTATGLLTVTDPGGGPTDFIGGVSPGGDYAVVAGGTPTTGYDPFLGFLIR